ncbi:MAG: CAP domain-containing protein [Armatimonadetes bacterium]|nr:CAP domain-containing protein [Armatimonadota bacterium]
MKRNIIAAVLIICGLAAVLLLVPEGNRQWVLSRWDGVRGGLPGDMSQAPGKAPAQDTAAIAQEIIRLSNTARQEQGLQPVTELNDLTEAALGHSEEMASLNYFAHESPTPGSQNPGDRVRLAGSWDVGVAENIYRCKGFPTGTEAAKCVDSWLNSPAHRANLLNPKYNSIGLGVYQVGTTFYVTQVFSQHDVHVDQARKEGNRMTLAGSVPGGRSAKGAIFLDNQFLSKFETDASGKFEVEFEASRPGVVGIGIQGEGNSFRIVSKRALDKV